MANAILDGPNLRIELTHDETVQFTDKVLPGGEAAIAVFLKMAGVPIFAVGVVAAALALHMAWEIPLIKNADKGHGVFLTAPIFPLGGAVLIPSTRFDVDNDGWSATDDFVIGSTEGDVIETHIDHNGDPATVVFRLNNQSPQGWNKAMVLRDGTGGEWWIEAGGFQQAENGLWSNQVTNGQPLSFWKPKFLHNWTHMFDIRGLEKIAPGSVVTFTWTKD